MSARSSLWRDSDEDGDMVRNSSYEGEGSGTDGTFPGELEKSGSVKRKINSKNGKRIVSKNDQKKTKPKQRNSAPDINALLTTSERERERERDSRPKSRSKKVTEAHAAAVFGDKAATLGLYA